MPFQSFDRARRVVAVVIQDVFCKQPAITQESDCFFEHLPVYRLANEGTL